jgi:5-methylcytosine-specific restriction endonuclease McrA
MSATKSRVPTALRVRIAEHAGYRCGYCLSSQELLGMPMNIEHIIPEALGGATDEANLWLSCVRCNLYKGARTRVEDPESGEIVALFDPRRESWNEHFAWNQAGVEILGRTSRGLATCVALRLNNSEIVVARRLWVAAGWWPPRR